MQLLYPKLLEHTELLWKAVLYKALIMEIDSNRDLLWILLV